jgi:dTDP-4-dehydrorhamnose 3,5-epimerase
LRAGDALRTAQPGPFGQERNAARTALPGGTLHDVVVDLRPNAPTRNRWLGFEFTPENMKQVYIPAGFAHGVQTLTDDFEVSYMISQFYTPQAAKGVRHNDPVFSINWPLMPTAMSERDRMWPLVRKLVH